MNTRIFRWKPNSGENHRCRRFSLQNLLLRKLLTIMYWCRLKPARRHPPAEGYNLLSFTSLSWKGATTLCSCLPASLGRELLPPALIYQPLLEGSYHPRLSFTSLSWKGATTPCSHLLATTRRELQPPHWRLRPLAPPWTTFHQFSYWIHQLPYNIPCRPLFIRFSDWTHSTHLSSTFIKLKLITPSINSLNHQPINQNLDL